MSCLTEKGGKHNTARHHPRESSAPESADPNRYTELPNTGNAKGRHSFGSNVADAGSAVDETPPDDGCDGSRFPHPPRGGRQA
jgi:hypothetical protein